MYLYFAALLPVDAVAWNTPLVAFPCCCMWLCVRVCVCGKISLEHPEVRLHSSFKNIIRLVTVFCKDPLINNNQRSGFKQWLHHVVSGRKGRNHSTEESRKTCCSIRTWDQTKVPPDFKKHCEVKCDSVCVGGGRGGSASTSVSQQANTKYVIYYSTSFDTVIPLTSCGGNDFKWVSWVNDVPPRARHTPRHTNTWRDMTPAPEENYSGNVGNKRGD